VSPRSTQKTQNCQLLELGLAWVLPLGLCIAFFFSDVQSLVLLICEGSKGDQLHGGGTGLPQVRGLVSRIPLLFFDVDLARFFLVF
jgi:hypothetical protein